MGTKNAQSSERTQIELQIRRALMSGGEKEMWKAINGFKSRADYQSLERLGARIAATHRAAVKNRGGRG